MPMARCFGPTAPNLACDLVAAAIVEEYLRRDPEARLDVRVSGGLGALFVAGTMMSSADFDVSAVVRRTLAQFDPSMAIEPFISIEPSPRPMFWDVPFTTFGYATTETSSFVPPAVELARDAVRVLLERAENDPEWFWLHPDVEVLAESGGGAKRLLVSATGTDGLDPAQAALLIQDVLAERLSGVPSSVQVQVSASAGLAVGVGSSGLVDAAYGNALPRSGFLVGHELRHPSVLGTALARASARELVQTGTARAAIVELLWRPRETRPTIVRARDERGRDLSAMIDVVRMDLATLPSEWLLPTVALDMVSAAFDPARLPPWERGVVSS